MTVLDDKPLLIHCLKCSNELKIAPCFCHPGCTVRCPLCHHTFFVEPRPVGAYPVQPRLADCRLRCLAESIYAEGCSERLFILGDALEEAGCTNADILSHCRQGREHVRGCWVVDLVLGFG